MARADDPSAQELLARIAWAAREPDEGEDVAALVERLEAVATPAQLPALLGLLDDDDARGIGWHLLYLAERFDDAYLAALVTALPSLIERGRQWAETAVLRIVNTAGEPDDCTAALASHAGAAAAGPRKTLVQVLDGIVASEADLLGDAQRAAIDAVRAAATGGVSPRPRARPRSKRTPSRRSRK